MAHAIDRLLATPTMRPVLFWRSVTLPRTLASAAGAEPAARAASACLVAAAGACWSGAREARPAVRTIAGAAGRRVPAVTAGAMGLHAAAEVAVAAGALANRELGQPPLFLLSLDARQLRADQRPVPRPLFHSWRLFAFDLVVLGYMRALANVVVNWSCGHWRGRRRRVTRDGRGRLDGQYGLFEDFGIDIRNDRGGVGREMTGKHFLVERRRAVLLAAARKFAPFVRVLRVARRAAGLLDVLFNHRNDGMVRQPPFARTVVIQYVTETQPALLHSHSREIKRVGLEEKTW